MTTIDWKSQAKGAGAKWAKSFVKQTPKIFYNEGNEQNYAPNAGGSSVWPMTDKPIGDPAITPTKHDPGCGYWPVGVQTPTPSTIGQVYVCGSAVPNVYVYDILGNLLLTIQGSVVGFSYPNGVFVYKDEVYILDYRYGVWVTDLNGNFKRKWTYAYEPPYYNPALYLYGIFVANDIVYVADYMNSWVHTTDLQGNHVGSGTLYGDGVYTGDEGFGICNTSMQSICIYNGNIYLGCDTYALTTGLTGGVGTQWGSYGSGPGQFDYTLGILGFNNQIYVGDSNAKRVQIFDTSGSYKSVFGSGQMSPTGIAEYNNELYISDQGLSIGGQGVSVWGLDGTLHRSWNTPGGYPWGIFVYAKPI